MAWRHQLVGLADAGTARWPRSTCAATATPTSRPRGYDLWTLAGDVAGLIRALGEPRADVVGHGWGGLVGWTVAALHPRLVRSLAGVGGAAPVGAAPGRAARSPRPGPGATGRYALGFQLPRWPERALRARGGDASSGSCAAWSGPSGRRPRTSPTRSGGTGPAIRIPGVVHCSMEYYRWAVRSQLRAEGRRFAAAVARPAEVPVLQATRRRRPVAASPAPPRRPRLGRGPAPPSRCWRASGTSRTRSARPRSRPGSPTSSTADLARNRPPFLARPNADSRAITDSRISLVAGQHGLLEVQPPLHPAQDLVVDLAGVAPATNVLRSLGRASPGAAAGRPRSGSPRPPILGPAQPLPHRVGAYSANRRSFSAVWLGWLSRLRRSARRAGRSRPARRRTASAPRPARRPGTRPRGTPSLRITVGSVSPCSSRVATVTKKARNTIVSRPGRSPGSRTRRPA